MEFRLNCVPFNESIEQNVFYFHAGSVLFNKNNITMESTWNVIGEIDLNNADCILCWQRIPCMWIVWCDHFDLHACSLSWHSCLVPGRHTHTFTKNFDTCEVLFPGGVNSQTITEKPCRQPSRSRRWSWSWSKSHWKPEREEKVTPGMRWWNARHHIAMGWQFIKIF